MARRKGRAAPTAPRGARTQHDYPPGWRPDDWLVPYIDGGACIHHGHTAPDDHSLCGPALFCCRRAAARYVALHPESCEAEATWELPPPIISWAGCAVACRCSTLCSAIPSDRMGCWLLASAGVACPTSCDGAHRFSAMSMGRSGCYEHLGWVAVIVN